jgi:hypothetical protein
MERRWDEDVRVDNVVKELENIKQVVIKMDLNERINGAVMLLMRPNYPLWNDAQTNSKREIIRYLNEKLGGPHDPYLTAVLSQNIDNEFLRGTLGAWEDLERSKLKYRDQNYKTIIYNINTELNMIVAQD